MSTLELEDEDSILAFTHGKRKEIVTALTNKGVPDDNAQVSLLLSTLKDMDHSALVRKRIKTDEKAIDRESEAAQVYATLLAKGQIKGLYETHVIENRVIPTLGNDIPNPVLVPGETDIGVSVETYDTFMEKQRALQESKI